MPPLPLICTVWSSTLVLFIFGVNARSDGGQQRLGGEELLPSRQSTISLPSFSPLFFFKHFQSFLLGFSYFFCVCVCVVGTTGSQRFVLTLTVALWPVPPSSQPAAVSLLCLYFLFHYTHMHTISLKLTTDQRNRRRRKKKTNSSPLSSAWLHLSAWRPEGSTHVGTSCCCCRRRRLPSSPCNVPPGGRRRRCRVKTKRVLLTTGSDCALSRICCVFFFVFLFSPSGNSMIQSRMFTLRTLTDSLLKGPIE